MEPSRTAEANSTSSSAPVTSEPTSEPSFAPVDPRNVNVSVQSMAFLLLITILVIAAAMMIHHVLRHKIKHVFAARCKVRRPVFPEPSGWPLSWIKAVVWMKEEKLLQQNGVDCVVYLRFLLMGLKLMAVCSVIVPVVIVPLNTVGIEVSPEAAEQAGLNRFTMSNLLDAGSHRILGHLVITYVVSVIAMWMFYAEYAYYVKLRHRYLASGHVQSRTVLIRNLPQRLRDDLQLENFIRDLDIGEVQAVHVAHHYREDPKKRVRARLQALKSLEREFIWIGKKLCRHAEAVAKEVATRRRNMPPAAEGRDDLTPREKVLLELHREHTETPVAEMDIWKFVFFDSEIRKLIREKYSRKYSIFWIPWRRGGAASTALGHYISEFCRLDELVRKMHERWKKEPTSDAFVVFKTRKAAQIATQMVMTPEPFSCTPQMAPEPRDVFWENLGISYYELHIRKFLVSAAIVVTTFFWLIPLVPIAALTTIDAIKKWWPEFGILASGSPVARTFLEPLPILLLQLAMVCVPMVFDFIARFERPESRGVLESKISSKTYFFLLFNILFLFSIGISVLNAVRDTLDRPISFIVTLAQKLPANAVFYSNYILISTIFSSLYILNYNSLFWSVIMARIVSTTPRDLWVWHLPLPPCYYYLYPYHLLVLAIALTYSTIYPFILLFAAFYFAVNFVVQANNFMFVYKANYESGGNIWKMVFDRLICGLVVFQLTMTGIFSLYQAIVHAGCTFLLVIVTLGFKVYCDIGFGRLSEVIPLSSLEDSDKRPPPIVTDTGGANNNDGSDNSSNADNDITSPNHGDEPESAAPISTGSLQRLWPRSSVESTNTSDGRRSGLPAGISTDTLDLDGTGVGSNWVAMWDKQEMHENIRNQTYRPTALVNRLPKRLWLPRDPMSMWKLELKATVKIKSAPAVSFRDDHRDSPAELAPAAAFSPEVEELPEPWSGNSATGSKHRPDTVLVELGRDSVPSRGSTSEKLTAPSVARRSHVSPSLSVASLVPAPFELGGPEGDREDDDDDDDEDPDNDDDGGDGGAEYAGNSGTRELSDRSPFVTSTPEIRSPSNERLLRSAPRSRPGGGGGGEGDHHQVAAPARRSGEVERLV